MPRMRFLRPGALGLALAAGFVSAACSSGGGGGGIQDPSVYEEELGRVAIQDLTASLDRILQKHNYDITRREEIYSTVYYETLWKPREAQPDELSQGVIAARSRIIVEGRRGGGGGTEGDIFRVFMKFENQAQLSGSGSWQPFPVTDDARSIYREVFGDLQMETRAGVRSIGE